MHTPQSPIAAHSPDPLMVEQSDWRGLGAATLKRRARGLLRGLLRARGLGIKAYFHSATLQRCWGDGSHMDAGGRAQGAVCVAPLRALRSLSLFQKPIYFNKLVKLSCATKAATPSILPVAAGRIYSGVFIHG